MAKKVAVLAVNPVNGCGLFQYLEAFFCVVFLIKYLRKQHRRKFVRIPVLL